MINDRICNKAWWKHDTVDLSGCYGRWQYDPSQFLYPIRGLSTIHNYPNWACVQLFMFESKTEQPMRSCFHPCPFVDWLVCQQDYTKTTEQISLEITGADKGTDPKHLSPFLSFYNIFTDFWRNWWRWRKSGLFWWLALMRGYNLMHVKANLYSLYIRK